MKISQIKDRAKLAFDNSHFKRNTAPKLMSILFAIVFWIYVMDQVNPEMIKTFEHQPITMEHMTDINNEGLVVMSSGTLYADVTVKGRRSDVINAQASDVKLYVDLEGIKEGTTKLELKRKTFRDGLVVNSASLNEIEVKAEQIVHEEKPVSIRYTGVLEQGMTSETPATDVRSTLVQGPRSLVKKVVKVEGAVDLSNALEAQKVKIEVHPVDRNGHTVEGVEVAVNEIEGTLNVFKVKEVPIKILTTGNVAPGYKLISITAVPSNVAVAIKGSVIKLPDYVSTKPITLTNLSDSKTSNIELELSDIIKPLVKTEEQTVSVAIQIEKVMTKEIRLPIDRITLTNVGQNLTGSIKQTDGYVVLKVSDVASVLDKIDVNTLAAYIDCNGLPTGVHKLKLNVEWPVVPMNVLVVPSTVQVDLAQN